jgi:hypothetical protein
MANPKMEPIERAHYLMSPYNLREARRRRPQRWIFLLLAMFFMLTAALVAWLVAIVIYH